jgi:hypothetical protein
MRHVLRATSFAAGIALMTASVAGAALAQDADVHHGKVTPGSQQAGPACDKVAIGGVMYAYALGRTDFQNIIFRHMDDGTDLYYQLGAAPLQCSEGAQTLPQIIWVN